MSTAHTEHGTIDYMSKAEKADKAVFQAVFDTNVLIDTMRDPLGAPARLIEAAGQGRIIPLATDAVRREYALIIQRMHPTGEDVERIRAFVEAIRPVPPQDVDVVIDDKEDYKFIQAAVGGDAQYIVTSDKHLLDIGEINTTRIVRPTEAIARMEDTEETGGVWQSWVKGLGIK